MFNQRRYRPRAVADLFDEAFDLYKSNFLLFLSATALVFVPLDAVYIFYVSPALESAAHRSGDFLLHAFDFSDVNVGLLIASWLVGLVFYTLIGSALVIAVSERYLDRPATLAGVYRVALRRTPGLLARLIGPLLLVALGSFLCVIPGVYLLAGYLCLPQVALLERQRSVVGDAKRAWQVGGASAWRNMGVLLLLAMVVGAITLAIEGPIATALDYLPLDSLPLLPELARHAALAEQIAAGFATLLVTPFAITLLTVLYYDLLIRNEAYDMTILSEHLGFPPLALAPAGRAAGAGAGGGAGLPIPPPPPTPYPAGGRGARPGVAAPPRRRFWQRPTADGRAGSSSGSTSAP